MQTKHQQLTQGPILPSLISFALPVLFALFLQAMYGAADLIIVGQFAGTYEQSGVASGSQLLNLITMVITGLSMGVTVFVAQSVGSGNSKQAGAVDARTERSIYTNQQLHSYLRDRHHFHHRLQRHRRHFPRHGRFQNTLAHRSHCVRFKHFGDLWLVAGLGMGAAGAAIATISAQAINVVCSFYFIKKKSFAFSFSRHLIRFDPFCVKRILLVGVPIALQELLVQFSFLFIQVIVNQMGVMESAAVGVSEKVCVFLMLVASAYMQSISAFVAQNNGAKRADRSKKALFYGTQTAFLAGAVMGCAAFLRATGCLPFFLANRWSLTPRTNT